MLKKFFKNIIRYLTTNPIERQEEQYLLGAIDAEDLDFRLRLVQRGCLRRDYIMRHWGTSNNHYWS